ncbi:uncharacterized protein LOC123507353 isoform X2 [Portunus trituberculatus]|uniref:uncharacterized protein LOC123507353 isoform X2 n=1 Tax=Portunus trituberculatus TaxID=210409 RepID=UPI001E1CBC18|nr:uncharacterized protein LOC123507353 isoform X2 [Portunus trituberculatus]
MNPFSVLILLLDRFIVRFYPCSNTDEVLMSMSARGVCKKEGSKICLYSNLKKKRCVFLKVRINNIWRSSLHLNLENVTFYNEASVIIHPWKHQGDTSTLTLNQIKSASSYKLKLTPKRSSEVSADTSSDCSTVILNGEEDRPNNISFTADWSQNLNKACKYDTELVLQDYCKNSLYTKNLFENQDDLLFWKPSPGKKVTDNTVATNTWMILAMAAVFFVVLVIILIVYLLHLKRMQQRSPSQDGSAIQIDKGSILTNSPPTVLLVYSPCLHQEMSVLSTKLQNKTMLKIEDLYSVGDQDKINDPTVWLTRRLMDINIRMVLAVSTFPTPSTQNNCSEEKEQGGVYHFLLDIFFHHLQSSKLAHDYSRLHYVRLENQIEQNLCNVTPGRLYLLPAHFNHLVRNLTLPASMFSNKVFSDM